MAAVTTPQTSDVRNVQSTSCCVVGGGPGGAMLALLLARQGIPVLLLEAHKDFDREFRGDTVHPSTVEILDEIGLADRLHQLPHGKVYGPVVRAADGLFVPFDLRRLDTRFPYIMLMHQPIFLEFLTEANVLAKPLKAGQVQLSDLAEVQRQREWPTRFIQAVQSFMQKRVVASVLRTEEAFRIPWFVRLFARVPILRDLPARLIAFGIWRVHVKN